MTRQDVQAAFELLWRAVDKRDMDAWCDLFAEDCTFQNPHLSTPVVGRENLRTLTRSWPEVDNQPEWHAIDGNRLVVGWNECHLSPKSSSRYRGFSTFIFSENGLVASYEAMFDTVQVSESINR